MKYKKIGLCHVLSWPKRRLESKFHDAGTFAGFEKRGHTDRQDSCFICIDFQKQKTTHNILYLLQNTTN